VAKKRERLGLNFRRYFAVFTMSEKIKGWHIQYQSIKLAYIATIILDEYLGEGIVNCPMNG